MSTRKNKKVSVWAEVAGWYGMAAALSAYLLVSFEVISAKEIAYQLLNLTGGIGMMIIAAKKHVTQSVAINAFWAAIAIIALFRIFI